MRERKVGFFLFDGVEMLEFSGPYEIFACANRLAGRELFQLLTISPGGDRVTAYGGCQTGVDHSIDDCPDLDVLVVPGGDGRDTVMQTQDVMNWVVHTARNAEKVMSVCSGALILAKGGLLDELPSTTHHRRIRALECLAPATSVVHNARFVDTGHILTTAGVSSGIDGAIQLLYHLHGRSLVDRVTRFIEHSWNTDGALVLACPTAEPA